LAIPYGTVPLRALVMRGLWVVTGGLSRAAPLAAERIVVVNSFAAATGARAPAWS
jgi:hypothetical protein